MVNAQNQGQPAAQNMMKKAQTANAQFQQESAGELTQSPGQISQLLLARAKAGFEFGKLPANNVNAGFNQNQELNQSGGQISGILAKESQ